MLATYTTDFTKSSFRLIYCCVLSEHTFSRDLNERGLIYSNTHRDREIDIIVRVMVNKIRTVPSVKRDRVSGLDDSFNFSGDTISWELILVRFN